MAGAAWVLAVVLQPQQRRTTFHNSLYAKCLRHQAQQRQQGHRPPGDGGESCACPWELLATGGTERRIEQDGGQDLQGGGQTKDGSE